MKPFEQSLQRIHNQILEQLNSESNSLLEYGNENSAIEEIIRLLFIDDSYDSNISELDKELSHEARMFIYDLGYDVSTNPYITSGISNIHNFIANYFIDDSAIAYRKKDKEDEKKKIGINILRK